MQITLRRPDDWHVHFRDGAMLEAVVPETARHFGRALVMPNLIPPVVTTKDALSYRERIIAAAMGADFTPLMTLYLTEASDPADIKRGWEQGAIHAVKLYPAGATTNSASGVSSMDRVMPALEQMAEIGLTLCVHGEVTRADVDIFDREAVFIEDVLAPLKQRLPELRVTMEHVTTREGIDFIAETSGMAGTITTHHLMINRNHMLVGGIRPHYYCLPIVKREVHQLALRQAAVSGNPKYFLGTDSAPHEDGAKETACGCAGCFTASNTLSCLAHVFEEESKLDRLEGFTSIHGANWYGLPPSETIMTLQKQIEPVHYADKLTYQDGHVTLFDPGVPLHWSVSA